MADIRAEYLIITDGAGWADRSGRGRLRLEGADAAAFDLCVLRSSWNYYENPVAFMGWVDRAARASRLLNPSDIVRWNLHKGYLRELEAAGIPVIPTAFVERAWKL